MIPIDQTIIDDTAGDCLRAAVASLFDLDITQVPHFALFGRDAWWIRYWFLWGMDWHLHGTRQEISDIGNWDASERYDSIPPTLEDCVLASVPSRTFDGPTHAVVMRVDGLIVHDPNPNRRWQGENAIESGNLISWELILPREHQEQPS